MSQYFNKHAWAWVKASVLLAVIFAMWVALIVVQGFGLIIAGTFAYPLPPFRIMLKSILLGQDQLINTFFGGYWKTTISSEIGALALSGSLTGLKMERVVNWIFKVSIDQDDHCRASIEQDDIHGTPVYVRLASLTGYIASIYTLNWVFA